MATLTGQSIASSYEQLLHTDTDGGGNGATLVPIKDGDNGTTFSLELATTSIAIGATHKLYLDGGGNTYITESSADTIQLATGGTTRMTIDGTGVGIGKSAGTILDIDSGTAGESSAESAGVRITGQRNGNITALTMRHEQASGSATGNNNGIGMHFQGYDGSNSYHNMGAIYVRSAESSVSDSDSPGFMTFHTTPNASDTIQERMRIDSSGRVGIGCSPSELLHLQSAEPVLRFTDSDDSKYHHIFASSDDLYISADRGTDGTGGNIIFRVGDTNVKMQIEGSGSILPGADDAQDLGSSSKRFDDIHATNGTIQTSDERLKDSIADSSLGLDFVNALRPVKYKWKNYSYDIVKEEAVEAKEAVYETVVIQEAVEAKEAVIDTRQKIVSKEVEKTKTEIVEEDGKYVQKEVSYKEKVEEPQYEEVNLYDEDGKVIGLHKIPIMEEYEVEPAIEAVEEVTEERLVSEAIEAKDAVMESKEKTFARTHFGFIAQEVEQVLKDSSLTNNDFAGLIYDEDADRYGIRYNELIAPLMKAVQELSVKVKELEAKL